MFDLILGFFESLGSGISSFIKDVITFIQLIFEFIPTLLTFFPNPFRMITLIFLGLFMTIYLWKLYKGGG